MDRSLVYSRLRDNGFSPKICIDGGACCGVWSGVIRSIFKDTIIMAVDANDWNRNGIIANADISEIQVLSEEDGKDVVFYKNDEGNCTGDSLFKENTYHYSENVLVKQNRVTTTLKSLCEKHGIKKIDLLKIDTQGSELIIMRGLSDMLNDIEFIELECSLVEYNVGGCTIGDVIDFLRYQFDIYEVVEINRHHGVELIQIDLIFKNKNCAIKKQF